MRLIGMLDSPYVRRVAISLKFMGLPFTHEAVSVFRHFDRFTAINPVVKAPTLVLDDGTVLMESTLMLDYLEQLAPSDRRLSPTGLKDLARAQRILGLALAACEKSVQLVYERNLRPAEKQHQPWIDRVCGQMQAAYRLLEAECADSADDAGAGAGAGAGSRGWLFGPRPLQADVTAAVVWRFTTHELPEAISSADHPALVALSERAEALPEFSGTPVAS